MIAIAVIELSDRPRIAGGVQLAVDAVAIVGAVALLVLVGVSFRNR